MAITIEYKDAENKLLILYLINMMDMAMSRSQITDFIIEKDLMNHFTLEQALADMVERGFLHGDTEEASDISITKYTLTEEGSSHLDLLEEQIPRPVRHLIDRYVEENRGKILRGLEKSTNHFYDADNDEFTVKCGVYDDKRGTRLMEIIVHVATREQVKQIQANWNANYSTVYGRVLALLTETAECSE